MTAYEAWQMEKYGNILSEVGEPELENGLQQQEDDDRKKIDQEFYSLTEQEF